MHKGLIPITKPFLGAPETKAASQAILSGWVSQGPKVRLFEEVFAKIVKTRYACAVSNCTTAMHLALLAVGVKPGDVVLTVSHSFIATANVIRYCLAEPVFIDIDLDTYTMSPQGIEECLREECETKNGELFYKNVNQLVQNESPWQFLKYDRETLGRVGAILVVHQMGMPCDLTSILKIAREHNLKVVEDAACALGSEITVNGDGSREEIGRPHGDIACFSFHPRKVITTGEGGMLTTNHEAYDEQFRLLRHQGMNVSDLQRHTSNKIIVERYPILGYNYRMTDIQAAVGIEQLKKLPKIIARRRKLARLYTKGLSGVPWLKVPVEPAYAKTNWQSYPLRLLDNAPLDRDDFMRYLLSKGVSTRAGIMNAHEENPYSGGQFELKNSELARRQAFLLPLYHELTENEVKKIISLIKKA